MTFSACHDLSFAFPIHSLTNTINISSLLDIEQIIQENDLYQMLFFLLLLTQFIVKQNYCYTSSPIVTELQTPYQQLLSLSLRSFFSLFWLLLQMYSREKKVTIDANKKKRVRF